MIPVRLRSDRFRDIKHGRYGRCEDEAFEGWVLSGCLEDGEGSGYGGTDVGFWRVEADDGSFGSGCGGERFREWMFNVPLNHIRNEVNGQSGYAFGVLPCGAQRPEAEPQR